ncbi:hypothetical protein [Winogradskyella helgolandensis]|uniref:hypothetical protein n=1 Tax=Winogradskyella helgolandensis TaxID=2697010 RepID=UPI0015BCD033|nr:hypothetical protein [Winogradskyella helgolandensis]
MKNLKFKLLSLIVICGLSFTSCSSDDDSSSSGDLEADTFITFTIDSEDYSFVDIVSAESNSITFNGNNGEGLSDAGDTQIALWLPLGITNGSFDVEPGFDAEYQISFTSESLNFDFDFAESGTITVTQSTGEYVEGTFTATITNDDDTTISIENGEFRALSMD